MRSRRSTWLSLTYILSRETVASGAEEQAIIEKIDIGGISLIRAAAKELQGCGDRSFQRLNTSR